MASVHEQSNPSGTTWRVKWRQDGKQRSLQFEDKTGAERFAQNVDQYGPEEALRVLKIEDELSSSVTVTEYLDGYIGSLTGVQPATVNRYRAYLANDITPAFGTLPLLAVTEDVIGRWVTTMSSTKDRRGNKPAAKTLANKVGFVSGAFNVAVRKGLMPSNPCVDRSLPETALAEKVYLTPKEFDVWRSCIPHQRYKDLATWLILTGMRFSEATALTPNDIDPEMMTCRIWQSWKYTGLHKRVLGPPKSKKSNRTISLSEEALDLVDLSQPEWLFTNAQGNPVTAQEFFNRAWKPARDKAQELGFKKSHVRVHDMRHSCASWMIQAGIPLPVVQAHLGHEDIRTTISTYFHLDQRQHRLAAQAVGNLLRNSQTAIGNSRLP